jgi:hypothetical protein
MNNQLVGRVLRASTVGYACGTRSNELDTPSFGAFVQTKFFNGHEVDVIGLIYAIHVDDDPLVRQLIMANHVNQATLRDQRENRMMPLEISVVNIGYIIEGQSYHNLPPRPPMSLDPVYLCDAECIYDFTQKLDFFRPDARPTNERHDFLVGAGRRLAQLLSHDLARLNHLLRLIKP